MTDRELDLTRARNAAEARAKFWKEVALGILVLLAFILICRYFAADFGAPDETLFR